VAIVVFTDKKAWQKGRISGQTAQAAGWKKTRYASFNCQKWKLNVAKALNCQRRYCILNTIEKAAWPGWTRLQECKKQ
jgi:hypothetical protein